MNGKIVFLLVGNGPLGNRGCQAIEMATIDLIRTVHPNAEFIIGNYNGDADAKTNDDPGRRYFKLCLEASGRRWSRTSLGYRLHTRYSLFSNLHYMNGFYEVLPLAFQSDAVLSLGGDLYAQTYGPFQMLNYLALGEAARMARKPFVVWPATLGPFSPGNRFDKIAIDRLKTYELVLCRDESSMAHCHEVGISNNLHLVADPAFLLEAVAPANIPWEIASLTDTIGINIGPYQGPNPRLPRPEWVQLIADCVYQLQRQLKKPILLIPHIVNQVNELGNCDHHFLGDVRTVLGKRGVCLAEVPIEWNARERKWLISQLRAFVGLRTHSTIAAFSSGVPCGCISYSAKAGALCDMFYGSRELMVPVQELDEENFVAMVLKLINMRARWAEKIEAALPDVLERARRSAEFLRRCVGGV